MQAELTAAGARIDAFYTCPYHAEGAVERYRVADHPDRKPNPGMILRAMRDLPIRRAGSFLIGDRESDLAAASAAGLLHALYTGGDLDMLVQAMMPMGDGHDA
jgi:D-glycero-D-manno-heptose 1,7-bisphosphate phosphatase